MLDRNLIELLAFLFMAAGNVIAVVKWQLRRTQRKQIAEIFVEDMALHHLPYIYASLTSLCGSLGVPIQEHPPIQFIKINTNGYKQL